MLAEARHMVIVEEVRRRGSVRVSELTDQLGVSEMTVRRDLDALAQSGLIEKVHGGATTRMRLTASASQFVVVADHTKWGVRGLVSIAALADADVLVTDAGLTRDARALLSESISEVVLAPIGRRRRTARQLS